MKITAYFEAALGHPDNSGIMNRICIITILFVGFGYSFGFKYLSYELLDGQGLTVE